MPPPPRRPSQPDRGRKPGPPPSPGKTGGDRGWDPVAAWYDKLVGDAGSDYHRHVILPATLKLLDPRPGESIVDVCCGQGVLAKPLLDAGVGRFLGVDASPLLIDAAKSRLGRESRVSLMVADVCKPGKWTDGSHDAAACVMAVHDVPDIHAMCDNVARALKPGGRVVLVFMHPCFRIPKRSHWGFDNDQKIQFRRIDAYGTPQAIPVTTHPGRRDSGETTFHHRPLAGILNALGASGLAVVACEELYSHRRSQASGPFSKAEHRAAEEFPLFIAIKAVSVGGRSPGPASQA